MSEQQELDWQEERETLYEGNGDDVDYFKPEQGRTEITFLDDGTQYSDQKKFDDDVEDYVVFRIEVDGEEYKWDMKKGQTPGSKFGMIARYAAAKDGLEGETVTWFRQGEGQNTQHMLLELDEIEEDEQRDSSDAGDGSEDVVFDDDEEEEETPIVDE